MFQEYARTNLPAKSRFAVVRIDATVDYLTANGEESEENGWKQIEEDFTSYLWGFNRFRSKSVPNARFDQWEECDDV